MKITQAQLTHFRSYEACEIQPCEGVNVLLGDNGQGKTNVLEALYLCCTGRSHRTRQDRELVRWGADTNHKFRYGQQFTRSRICS